MLLLSSGANLGARRQIVRLLSGSMPLCKDTSLLQTIGMTFDHFYYEPFEFTLVNGVALFFDSLEPDLVLHTDYIM